MHRSGLRKVDDDDDEHKRNSFKLDILLCFRKYLKILFVQRQNL